MLILVGLVIGVVIALVVRPTISPDQARYLAVVVVAALDAGLGGLRAYLEQTFSDRMLLVAFATNAVLAVTLVWLGDQLGVDLVTAVAVVLGFRVFQNAAAIRRRGLRS